jgi:hypothetical protein
MPTKGVFFRFILPFTRYWKQAGSLVPLSGGGIELGGEGQPEPVVVVVVVRVVVVAVG